MNTISFSELLKRSWEIYVNNFRHFLMIALFFILPLRILSAVMNATSLLPFENATVAENPTTASWILYGSYAAMSVIIGIFISLVVIRITASAIQQEKHAELSLQKELRASLSLLLPAIGTAVLHFILMMMLFALFVVPGIIFGGYWIFTTVIVALRGQTYFSALRMSRAYVKGRWWEVASRAFYCTIILVPFIILFTIPLSFITQGWLLIAVEILSFTVMEIISIFFTIFLVVYFLELEKTVQK